MAACAYGNLLADPGARVKADRDPAPDRPTHRRCVHVIPARAGIHDLPSSQRENSQIPACAGMAKRTVGGSVFTAVSMTGRFPGVATGPDTRLCCVQAALSGR